MQFDYCIPRCYSSLNNVKSRQLLGFCDASPKAYCVVIFMQIIDHSGNVTSLFVCTKTRVAPLKELTFPGLELLSAIILSQLLSCIARNF